MTMTEEVKEFLQDTRKVGGSFTNKLVDMFEKDIKHFDDSIINEILRGTFKVDGNWESYKVSDVDAVFEENMLRFKNKLDMFGIAKLCPTIRADDKGMVAVYRFTMFDAFGGELDSLVAFHLALVQTKISPIPVSKFIVMYDQ